MRRRRSIPVTRLARYAHVLVRSMQLDGAQNVRDLGGYRTAHGHEGTRGAAFRGGALSQVSPADLTTLGSLRLLPFVDFRLPEKFLLNGEDRLPDSATLVRL